MEAQVIKFPSFSNLALAEDIDDLLVAEEMNGKSSSFQSSFSIDSSKVVIEVAPTSHSTGSSIMVTSNITNFTWNYTYSPGTLVDVHMSGNFIAYAIVAHSSSNGIVRIISKKSGVRSMIKNIQGVVKDLAFAHLAHRILLAFIDEFATLYVYEITEIGQMMNTNLLMEIKRNSEVNLSEYQRVLWCPFLPDDVDNAKDNDDNFGYMLLSTNGSSGDVYHVLSLINKYGSGLLDKSDFKFGSKYQSLEEPHSAPISDAAFSPDGTALATASLDGFVKFFKVSFDGTTECLHKWRPHDGKPLSCIFFLDNKKDPSPDVQFWKYAVTGACNNSEIKVWPCCNWKCTQTINFKMCGDKSDELTLKAAIDPTANYLVLSDIYRKVLYVLILFQEPPPALDDDNHQAVVNGRSPDTQDPSESAERLIEEPSEGSGRVISISEIPVQFPVLFLSITSAEWKAYKRWKYILHPGDIYRQDNDDDDDNDADIVEGVVMKSVFITTKTLQEATTRLQPSLPSKSHFRRTNSLSGGDKYELNSSGESTAFKDGLTDLSINLSSSRSELDNSSLSMNTTSQNINDIRDKEGIPSSPSTSLKNINDPSNILKSLIGMTPKETANSSDATNFLKSLVGLGSIQSSDSNDTTNILNSLVVGSSQETTDPVAGLSSASLVGNVSNSVFSKSRTSPTVVTTGTLIDSGRSSVSPPNDVVSQPPGPPLSLLTPESFSSPTRNEDEDLLFNRETIPDAKAITSPSEDLKSAAYSLLLRVNSGSGLPSQSPDVNKNSLPAVNNQAVAVISSRDLDDPVLSNSILKSAISGSSRSSPVNVLPPLPSSLPNQEAPLATSEVSVAKGSKIVSCSKPPSTSVSTVGGGSAVPVSTTLASSTSSPSLEVQQILLTHSDRNGDDYVADNVDGLDSLSNKPTEEVLNAQPKQAEFQTSRNAAVPKSLSNDDADSDSIINMLSGLKVMPGSTANGSLNAVTPSTHSSTAAISSASLVTASSPACSFGDFGSLSEGGQKSLGNLPPYDVEPSLPTLKRKLAHLTCEEIEAGIINHSSPSERFNKAIVKKDSKDQMSISMERDNRILEEVKFLHEYMKAFRLHEENEHKALIERNRSISDRLEKYSKSIQQMEKGLDEMKKSQSKILNRIPHIISSSSKGIIEPCLRQELRNALLPVLRECIEPIRAQLLSETRSLVLNTESHLTDSLVKHICSKNFVENVSSSVSSYLSVSVKGACKESYNDVVVPGFNAITKQVFSQLNEAFSKGTKEYMQHVENESTNTRKALIDNLSSSSRNLETASTTLSTNTSVLMDYLQKNLAQQTSFTETFGDRLKQAVKEEVSKALQDHYATIEARTSRAPTPASSVLAPNNPKIARQQIQQLISQGQFNSAFKQALSASDLSLVVFVCERFNPQQLFGQTPCPLSQDVLLSLVNQLSHDLTTFTDLKTKYLEESVMNLDSAHPVTKEHKKQVLQELQRSLTSHIELNPNHKKLKMLLLAVNHLVTAGE